ncbi:hypothetical protein AWH62_09130 [Maricaulis sp. W15]|uniref:hypothetical protein n=1 Tax=Maricaulis sp. W15 TaxID=1772333 RepID=UPI00094913F8|nr:hypothetical protein [Maricaulis sp. W15]OLF73098.1 hypothetical protein AWH62_09130 [Maricaulis sp. W15]
MKLVLRVIWQGLLPIWGLVVLCAVIWDWFLVSGFWQPDFAYDSRMEVLGEAVSPSGELSLSVQSATRDLITNGEMTGSFSQSMVALKSGEAEYAVAYLGLGEDDRLSPLEQDDRLAISWASNDRVVVTHCGLRFTSMQNAVTLREDADAVTSPVRQVVEVEYRRRDDCGQAPPEGPSFSLTAGDVRFYGQTSHSVQVREGDTP